MAFKQHNNPFRKTPSISINRKDIKDGSLGKANNDGTIDIDRSVKKDSPLEKKIIRHEKQHMRDMDNGKLSYTDDNVVWNGKKYPRKNGMIKYKGKWCKEGDDNLPWEREAKKKE